MSGIPVHRLTTVLASGSEQVERLVECPADRRSVPIEACTRCGYGRGTSPGDAEHAEAVECDRADKADGAAGYEARLQIVPASKIATRDVVGVASGAPIGHAKAMMLESVIGCVPVLDGAGRPLGIISPLDLLTHSTALSVDQAMSSPVATVGETTSITRAAALMAFEGIHHLPIVNQQGAIVAMLSSLDVLRHLGREQGFIVPDDSQRRRGRQT